MNRDITSSSSPEEARSRSLNADESTPEQTPFEQTLLEPISTEQMSTKPAPAEPAPTEPIKKKKKPKLNSRMPLPFDLPYRKYYGKVIPAMQIFRAALLQHYATESARYNPLKRGLRSFADLLFNHHSHIAAECGVYRGSSLVVFAEIIRQYGLNAHIYGLDSFQGFPELCDTDEALAADLVMDIINERGTIFDDTSLAYVQESLDERELSNYVTLVPGFFSDTLHTLPKGPYFFVFIDCDLYEGHLECLEFFYSKVEKGGIIFFDDYYSIHYPMAREAVDTFMKGRSEELFHIRYGKEKQIHNKAFFVKH